MLSVSCCLFLLLDLDAGVVVHVDHGYATRMDGHFLVSFLDPRFYLSVSLLSAHRVLGFLLLLVLYY